MAKYFRFSFASAGDRTAVEDATNANGVLTYQSGYGPQYSADLQSDPNARRLNRDRFNQVINDITSNLQQWQTVTAPSFVTAAENGGTAISYRQGSVVDNGTLSRVSLVDNNTADVADPTNWANAYPWPIALGGTGATTTTGAATNLGVLPINGSTAMSGDLEIVKDNAGINLNSNAGTIPFLTMTEAGGTEGFVLKYDGDVSNDVIFNTIQSGTERSGFSVGRPLASPFIFSRRVQSTIAPTEDNDFIRRIDAFKKFTSSPQVISSGGLITLAHGLTDENGNPASPVTISFFLRCLTAEFEYSVGDEILVDAVNNTSTTTDRRNSIIRNTTNIVIRLSSATQVFVSANTAAGDARTLTNANWELIVEAGY